MSYFKTKETFHKEVNELYCGAYARNPTKTEHECNGKLFTFLSLTYERHSIKQNGSQNTCSTMFFFYFLRDDKTYWQK